MKGVNPVATSENHTFTITVILFQDVRLCLAPCQYSQTNINEPEGGGNSILAWNHQQINVLNHLRLLHLLNS